MAKVKIASPEIRDLKETIVLSTLVKFNDEGIAEVKDADVIAEFREVAQATGKFEIIEESAEEQKAEANKKSSTKKSAPADAK